MMETFLPGNFIPEMIFLWFLSNKTKKNLFGNKNKNYF